MKIKVEKWIVEDESFYKIVSVEDCCGKLMKSKNIDINNEFCEEDTDESGSQYKVKLVRIEDEFDSTGEDDVYYYYEAIDYCPFCGTRIEIKIIGEIDKTEEFQKFYEEREKYWTCYSNTYNIKEQSELLYKIKILQTEMDDIESDDDFDSYLDRETK
jgi:hypothetical protein